MDLRRAGDMTRHEQGGDGPGLTGIGLAIAGAALPAIFPTLPFPVALSMIVTSVGLIGWAFVRHILDVRRDASREPRATVTAIGFDDALRYIVCESRFGCGKDAKDPNFAIWIGDALEAALIAGDIAARGRRFHVLKGSIRNPPLHPRATNAIRGCTTSFSTATACI